MVARDPKSKIVDLTSESSLRRKTYILASDVLMRYPGIIPGEEKPDDPYSALIPVPEDDPLYSARFIIPDSVIDELDEASKLTSNAGRGALCVLGRIAKICQQNQFSLRDSFNLQAFHSVSRKSAGGAGNLGANANTNANANVDPGAESPAPDDAVCELTVLPLSDRFYDDIPWAPGAHEGAAAQTAMIALQAAAVAIGRFDNGEFTDKDEFGDSCLKLAKSLSPPVDNYIVVTNSRSLIAKARMLGLATMNYHLTEPLPHTGIRYYAVPDDLLDQLQFQHGIDYAAWRAVFPQDIPLANNEYVVLYPMKIASAYRGITKPVRLDPASQIVQDNPMPMTGFDYVGVLKNKDTNPVIKPINIRGWLNMIPGNNPEYAAYIDALHDPSISTVIVTGSAGTGKTYGAFNTASDDILAGEYTHAIVLKDGRHVLGAVPGGVEQKMAPLVGFGKDALGARIAEEDKDIRIRREEERKHGARGLNGATSHERVQDNIEMKWRNFSSVPYEDSDGRSFPNHVILLDEIQRVEVDVADTLFTRLGKKSKMIIMGDINQLKRSTDVTRAVNGLTYARELFYDEPCAASINLLRVVRGESTATVIRNRTAVRARMGLTN